ncbi:uncharacterized protein LOC142986024 [Anticarsia gemmatalis]|uniref:uncharacterized protein LOC142985810 n=1 Tax=Anticarsia gemmatalis TaxID=129554 RepID=UPI003F75B6A5
MSDREEDPMLHNSATQDATSEVECTRAEDPEEISHNQAMTSRCDENLLRTLLAAQNQNMMSLIEAIKEPRGTKHISLPEFDPDKLDVDARAWCATADLCLSEVPLFGSALIITLSKAMKGSASRWLAQVSFAGMTWCDFKSLFLSRYDCVDTPAATLVKMISSKPKEDECYAAYAARLLSTLTSRWQNLSAEQIAVSTVLAHMAQFDGRIQRLAFTTDVKDRHKLQCELQAFSFLKRKASMNNSTDTGPEFKRSKFQSTSLKCHNRGKVGHRATDCRSRGEVKGKASNASTPSSSFAVQKSRSDIICFRCGNVGHFASKCPRSNEGTGPAIGPSGSGAAPAAAASSERRVEVCYVSNPSGTLMNTG